MLNGFAKKIFGVLLLALSFSCLSFACSIPNYVEAEARLLAEHDKDYLIVFGNPQNLEKTNSFSKIYNFTSWAEGYDLSNGPIVYLDNVCPARSMPKSTTLVAGSLPTKDNEIALPLTIVNSINKTGYIDYFNAQQVIPAGEVTPESLIGKTICGSVSASGECYERITVSGIVSYPNEKSFFTEVAVIADSKCASLDQTGYYMYPEENRDPSWPYESDDYHSYLDGFTYFDSSKKSMDDNEAIIYYNRFVSDVLSDDDTGKHDFVIPVTYSSTREEETLKITTKSFFEKLDEKIIKAFAYQHYQEALTDLTIPWSWIGGKDLLSMTEEEKQDVFLKYLNEIRLYMRDKETNQDIPYLNEIHTFIKEGMNYFIHQYSDLWQSNPTMDIYGKTMNVVGVVYEVNTRFLLTPKAIEDFGLIKYLGWRCWTTNEKLTYEQYRELRQNHLGYISDIDITDGIYYYESVDFSRGFIIAASVLLLILSSLILASDKSLAFYSEKENRKKSLITFASLDLFSYGASLVVTAIGILIFNNFFRASFETSFMVISFPFFIYPLIYVVLSAALTYFFLYYMEKLRHRHMLEEAGIKE